MNVFRFLKAHPLAMQADFEHVLVLTYAVPDIALQPLVPPGLVLDAYENYGFLAIAMVQARNMRPRFTPRLLGRDFFLTGYRVFTRYRMATGKTLRGLRILRSDTNADFMARWGNRLTHYQYQKADVDYRVNERMLEIKTHTPRGEADLHVRAHLSADSAPLPLGSPFPNLQVARRFAGPLPFTFDYEAETHSIIRVQGVRQSWNPQTIRVEVLENTFIEKEPFASAHPVLASAFHLGDVSYRWKRGVREEITV
jgi:hypothetical protein